MKIFSSFFIFCGLLMAGDECLLEHHRLSQHRGFMESTPAYYKLTSTYRFWVDKAVLSGLNQIFFNASWGAPSLENAVLIANQRQTPFRPTILSASSLDNPPPGFSHCIQVPYLVDGSEIQFQIVQIIKVLPPQLRFPIRGPMLKKEFVVETQARLHMWVQGQTDQPGPVQVQRMNVPALNSDREAVWEEVVLVPSTSKIQNLDAANQNLLDLHKQRLLAFQSRDTLETVRLARQLTQNCQNDVEKVNALFLHVSQNLETEMASRTSRTQEVNTLGKGGPYQKTQLLRSLMDSLGLNTHVIFVQPQKYGPFTNKNVCFTHLWPALEWTKSDQVKLLFPYLDLRRPGTQIPELNGGFAIRMDPQGSKDLSVFELKPLATKSSYREILQIQSSNPSFITINHHILADGPLGEMAATRLTRIGAEPYFKSLKGALNQEGLEVLSLTNQSDLYLNINTTYRLQAYSRGNQTWFYMAQLPWFVDLDPSQKALLFIQELVQEPMIYQREIHCPGWSTPPAGQYQGTSLTLEVKTIPQKWTFSLTTHWDGESLLQSEAEKAKQLVTELFQAPFISMSNEPSSPTQTIHAP